MACCGEQIKDTRSGILFVQIYFEIRLWLKSRQVVLVSLAVVGVFFLERFAFVLEYVALLLFFGFPCTQANQ